MKRPISELERTPRVSRVLLFFALFPDINENADIGGLGGGV